MPVYLLCIDPGKMSGVALFHVVGGEPELVWSEETDYFGTCNLVNKTLLEYGGLIRVICEKFIINQMTARNGVAPWSLELIGVVKYLCMAYGIPEPILQTASKAKNFCPNQRLRSLGFWHRGGAGHARDAIRHGVTHLVDCGWHSEKLVVN